jgi:hypothetical protein
MSDLSSQLRQVADDAAGQARPMAVAEVIRRGNRRRQRVIAQRSLSGLSAVGLGAAIVFTGAAGNPSAPESGSAAASHGITSTEQTTSAAGKISVVVKYQDERHGKIKILSLTFSAHSKAVIKHPSLEVTLQETGKKGSTRGAVFITGTEATGQNFTGSVPRKVIATLEKGKGLNSGLEVTVGLVKGGTHSVRASLHPILEDELVLN